MCKKTDRELQAILAEDLHQARKRGIKPATDVFQTGMVISSTCLTRLTENPSKNSVEWDSLMDIGEQRVRSFN